MNLAPVVLFVYNRPEHTRSTLEALSKAELAEHSHLIIFSDAPKNVNDIELNFQVSLVRDLIRGSKWCKSIEIIHQDNNKGLSKSIIDGVSTVINKYGKVIVLEDDIVVSKGFLRFMNDALEIYKNDEQVMHVSGYIYPYYSRIPAENIIFLKILSCWGWATWQRAWVHFNGDVDFHLQLWTTPKQIKKFNIEGHADYYQQLILNKERKIFSWAVKWYSSWLNKEGISLFPIISLVKNIGHDGTGIHCMQTNIYNNKIADYLSVKKLKITETLSIRKSIDQFYKRMYSKLTFAERIKSKFENLLKKI